MESPRETDQRLRTRLNGNQPNRERLCLAILALDRNYSDIRPRRPEGGRDGGRDIECYRLGERCFGAVGFLNNACDSPRDKAKIKKKFTDDVALARATDNTVKAFVFFCNVDLTPTELKALEDSARRHGFTAVDIYWRERIRQVLDGVEGLAYRFQFLQIELSSAEQASFFSRFGKDIQDVLRGRFDRLERKLDELEFARWKAGHIRSVRLDVGFKDCVESLHKTPYHFRVCLELQGVYSENRDIVLGACDDFWQHGGHEWHFGTRTFFWQSGVGDIKGSWISNPARMGGGVVLGIHLHVQWRPVSPMLATAFDGLCGNFHFTQNLSERISNVRFSLDDYVFFDQKIDSGSIEKIRPRWWPDELNKEDASLEWRGLTVAWLGLDRMPLQTS